ncbi:hypothetical protein P154DRAFT_223049 [Amniculicola lignicola CBS 123094]|uniref:Putative phospholipase n=1 Tax=Amniculicola lignicola CBS 123094 TaxID=1392246 RepID=A0A6A5WYV8_9PLEO|nr:hypothetical protein P154DRAFT_223049 [Amniculicola lignicola CBS 123094]
MAILSKLNPTPTFPCYTGAYKVGSADIEVPIDELESPSPAPTNDIPTVSFRVFYPCQNDAQEKGVRWVPNPQREYIGAYARFLGANSGLSQVFSLIPQLLYYITIPVHQNAAILEPPTTSKRWPVMIFSHGLGGSRNAYSHLVGSLASHGIVVIAPDHRDGSAPISFVHTQKGKLKKIEYRRVAHKASTEVYEARDEQLKIRLWELGLIHDALLKLDDGATMKNVADNQVKDGGDPLLKSFSHKFSVREPGSIAFSGHSFGAVTMVQFVKSVFYRTGTHDANYKPLLSLTEASSLVRQITPKTSVALLDLWGLPIQSPATRWLKEKPMPCYTSPEGGENLLAILSEAFYKWSSNLEEVKSVVAKPSRSKFSGQPGPHIFYPAASAHLSQSDFGVIMPFWLTSKIFGAKEPERLLKLNVRAILQVLRNSNMEVSATCVEDLELDEKHLMTRPTGDEMILRRTKDSVRDWISLSTHPEPLNLSQKKSNGAGDVMVEGEALGEVVSEPERQ